MPTIRLTQAAVEKLNPPKSGRTEFFDTHLPGFGLRIADSGHKAWVVFYRIGGGSDGIRSVRSQLTRRLTSHAIGLGRFCGTWSAVLTRPLSKRLPPGGNRIQSRKSRLSSSNATPSRRTGLGG